MSDKTVTLKVGELELKVPMSKAMCPAQRWHLCPSEFAHRLIVGHKLNHGIAGDLEREIRRVTNELYFDKCAGDKVLEEFDMDELDDLLEDFEDKKPPSKQTKQLEIFDQGRYNLMEKLVNSEAVTHMIELEQRMRNQRKIIVKNRGISIQKMIERHQRELGEVVSDSSIDRHLDDRERIESHFREEIQILEQKQRAEFIFNAERLIKDAARGNLKAKDVNEGDWVEVPETHIPPNQESFTVNLGNQLKLTQNLRLVQCNLCDEIKPPRNSKAARLESLFNLFAGFSSGIVLPVANNSIKYIDEQFDDVRRSCIENTDFLFPSIDEQLLLAAEKVDSFPEDCPIITRHSNLSASAHVIFHLYVGKLHLGSAT
ncbi:unnamed protein product [Oikopleura dioica]|uniref:Uncharacterized protein n=1 Tax=Oikopleura dioica TaxID=34765 RepID=E4YHQ1_OIKDI|nr:unnamed protein product [Oikopleura dioica]